MTNQNDNICPECLGKGTATAFDMSASGVVTDATHVCNLCGGSGIRPQADNSGEQPVDLDAFWKGLHISKKARLYEDYQAHEGSFAVIPPRRDNSGEQGQWHRRPTNHNMFCCCTDRKHLPQHWVTRSYLNAQQARITALEQERDELRYNLTALDALVSDAARGIEIPRHSRPTVALVEALHARAEAAEAQVESLTQQLKEQKA